MADWNSTGIIGYFDPSGVDIEAGLWHNQIAGYNDIQLTGGSFDGKILSLNVGEFGSFACDEPLTVYCIALNHGTTNESEPWFPIITKCLTTDSLNYGFDLFKYINDSNEEHMAFSAVNNDVSEKSVVQSMLICAYTCQKSGLTEFYTGKYYSGRTPSNTRKGNYGGVMYLNTTSRGGQIPVNNAIAKTDYIMVAFGTAVHDSYTIQQNMEYLAEKYELVCPWHDYILGMAMQPLFVTAGGEVTNGMPNTRGALYIYDCNLYSGSSWTNQVSGGRALDIGGAVINDYGIGGKDMYIDIPETLQEYTIYAIPRADDSFTASDWTTVLANYGEVPQFNLCTRYGNYSIGAGGADGIYYGGITMRTQPLLIQQMYKGGGSFYHEMELLHNYGGYFPSISGQWHVGVNFYFKFIGIFGTMHNAAEMAQNVAWLKNRFNV